MAIINALLCAFFFFCHEIYTSETAGTLGRRADTPLEIETLVIADYSAYNKWYELLDSSIPHAKRVDMAKQNLTTWLGAMVNSANIVYKRLEDHGIFISIKLVDLLIMTTVEDSPWTEKTKFVVNSTYMIDPDVVHPLLQNRSVDLQKTIPHDHAILFTKYTLIHGRNGTKTLAGNAYLGAECKPRSQSIVEDSEEMYTSNTIAHELGHSLGCQHDGENNTCEIGYLMEASYVSFNKNKWIFSQCSVDYIRNFIDKLNRQHENCLAKVNDHHPKPELALASQQFVGELYSVDEQCVISEGRGSYMCRHKYKGNFTEFCLIMLCYNPEKDGCYNIDAGDGTHCGDGSWCISNTCVKDSRAPKQYDASCPFGDQTGVVHKQMTCKELAAKRPNDCLRQDVKQRCCQSCRNVQTTAVPVDTQCKEELGPDSYMCRTVDTYNGNSYSSICSDLYCFNVSGDDCHSFEAYDKTPCGYKKWCQDGQCVADTRAPAVPDECPMGDRENARDVSYNNFTCAEIRLHNHNLECYSNYTQKHCCKTCSELRRNLTGCEYGDHHESCFTLITSKKDSHYCYRGENANICCESCNKYRNATNTGCEYGDKNSGCANIITTASDSGNCYGKNSQLCCGSCKQYFNASNVGCEYGDKATDCASLIASRAESYNCYAGNNADLCCGTCSKYYEPSHKGCEYGDKATDCASLIASRAKSYYCYAGNNADLCCGTCSKYYEPSHIGCEYGDKVAGCSPTKCSTYTPESRKSCCLSCKSDDVLVG